LDGLKHVRQVRGHVFDSAFGGVESQTVLGILAADLTLGIDHHQEANGHARHD